MKKILIILLLMTTLISNAQLNKYQLDIKTSLIKNEINLNDGKYHILTYEMLKPFRERVIYPKISMIIKRKDRNFKLYLPKVNNINYHFENKYYYNPIIYKLL